MTKEEVENLVEHYREIEPEQAKIRKQVIERLKEESKIPMTALEIRKQAMAYVIAEMPPDYPREKVEEYFNRNYGRVCDCWKANYSSSSASKGALASFSAARKPSS